MFVWWGPELINIYNDSYIPMLGNRHPSALGRPAQDSWNDIWDVVGAQAHLVMYHGQATWNDRVKLVMERHGYSEDTWFTWSYSPILDESGKIGGLFCAVTEETHRVRAETENKRLAAQIELALNAAHMGWWHFDPISNVSYWDERFRRIFALEGLSADNSVPLSRIHADDLPRVLAAVEATLNPANPRPPSTSSTESTATASNAGSKRTAKPLSTAMVRPAARHQSRRHRHRHHRTQTGRSTTPDHPRKHHRRLLRPRQKLALHLPQPPGRTCP